ncbi:hypothetical protein FJZ31_11085 [Candidatus Poribacteria bacterium]|nr:hypothetical protein [Candidatus Poribacteria bacterium]
MTESPDREHINIWLAYSDLFTGVLVIITVLFVFNLHKVQEPKPPENPPGDIPVIITGAQTEAIKIVAELMKSLSQASIIIVDTKTPVGSEISLCSDILFISGGYDDFLRNHEARAKLKELGVSLKKQLDKLEEEKRKGLKIVVEGHTDAENLSDDYARSHKIPSNWELSTRRATEVVKFLKDECGLDPNLYNITAVGYGEFRPKVDNYRYGKLRPREELAPNRRIDIRIAPDYERLLFYQYAPSATSGLTSAQPLSEVTNSLRKYVYLYELPNTFPKQMLLKVQAGFTWHSFILIKRGDYWYEISPGAESQFSTFVQAMLNVKVKYNEVPADIEAEKRVFAFNKAINPRGSSEVWGPLAMGYFVEEKLQRAPFSTLFVDNIHLELVNITKILESKSPNSDSQKFLASFGLEKANATVTDFERMRQDKTFIKGEPVFQRVYFQQIQF